jgi:ribosomal protein S6
MNDIKDDRTAIYEIGYLLVSSIPEEKVSAEAESLKKIITDAGASLVSEEAPYQMPLAYTMRKKMVSGAYEKYDQAYFGWVKFELSSGKVEQVKKDIEVLPSVLRTLLVTTVRENTYLGKRAASLIAKTAIPAAGVVAPEEKKDAAPATIEEMDKSIDAMVKEV